MRQKFLILFIVMGLTIWASQAIAAEPTVAAQKPSAARPTAARTTSKAASQSKPSTGEVYKLANTPKTDPNWDKPYLMAAYALSWLLFLAYLVSLAIRSQALESNLERLERKIESLDRD